MRHLPSDLVMGLLDILNNIWQLSDITEGWKKAKLFLLLILVRTKKIVKLPTSKSLTNCL